MDFYFIMLYTIYINLKKGCDSMTNAKEQVIKVVNKMPDNATIEDIIYNIYFQVKLAKSEEDIKNGRVMSLEESKARLEELYENYNI